MKQPKKEKTLKLNKRGSYNLGNKSAQKPENERKNAKPIYISCTQDQRNQFEKLAKKEKITLSALGLKALSFYTDNQ